MIEFELKTIKTDKMEILIKHDLLGFKNQLHNFCEGLTPAMITLLGLDATEVANLKKTRDLVNFIFSMDGVSHEYAQNMSKYTRILFHGLNDEILGPIPVGPAYPAILPDVTSANSFKQFSDFVQDCKRSPNFTSNVAEGLGVLAPASEFDPNTGVPEIKLSITTNGHPLSHLRNKGKYDGFEIWKMVFQGAGPIPPQPDNFRKLERVFGVDYVDPEPLPVFGQSQVWLYKYFYILKNQPAGIVSPIYNITVNGVV
jgi:hypothetical protein